MATDPFIDPKDLANMGPLRYIDARSEEAFAAGTAPSAVRVSSASWDIAAKAPAVRFNNLTFWQHVIDELGLGGRTTGVVFDDGTMVPAARVWFFLQLYGAKAFIINGGWPAMRRVEPLRLGAPGGVDLFEVRTGFGPVGIVERQDLRDQLPGQAQVFDTRTLAEFSGEDMRRNPRGGHIPGARNLPHNQLLSKNGIKSPWQLRKLLESAGFQKSDRIVTHCEGGGRAALAAAAAVRAGFDSVRVYYDSFADWSLDDTCPVVRD